jgi:hypothetical protein
MAMIAIAFIALVLWAIVKRWLGHRP